MTAKEALFKLEDCGISKVAPFVALQCVILDDLLKLEKIAGYIKNGNIIPELKIEIIKNIIDGKTGKLEKVLGCAPKNKD